MTNIRRLEPDDRSEWEPLWQGYLDFYEHHLDAATTEHTWARLVGNDPALVGLVSVNEGKLVGICHLVFHPSTWSATSYCYLEDLFVDPERRSGGVGLALITAAEEEARQAGASKLYWQTHTGNPARQLYDRVAEHHGFVVYELDLDGGTDTL